MEIYAKEWSKSHKIQNNRRSTFLTVTWAALFENTSQVYSDICQDICLHHISAIFAPWESQNRERKGHPSATNSCHIFCFVCNLLSWALNMIFLFKDFLPRYIFSLCNFSVLLRCKYRAWGLIPERYLFLPIAVHIHKYIVASNCNVQYSENVFWKCNKVF